MPANGARGTSFGASGQVHKIPLNLLAKFLRQAAVGDIDVEPDTDVATDAADKVKLLGEVAGSVALGSDTTADIRNADAITREWAEGFARLPLERPPGDVPLRRWHRLINDIADFGRDGWLEKAAVLGWTLSDLVGADPERPFARLDKTGLLWLLDGNRLVAISEKTARIETNTGARHTYRRKPYEPGRVLVWDLTEKRGPQNS